MDHPILKTTWSESNTWYSLSQVALYRFRFRLILKENVFTLEYSYPCIAMYKRKSKLFHLSKDLVVHPFLHGMVLNLHYPMCRPALGVALHQWRSRQWSSSPSLAEPPMGKLSITGRAANGVALRGWLSRQWGSSVALEGPPMG